jgi:hypothetical protein
MRRQSGQKALYEAMSRSRSKPKRLSLLERLRPQLEKLRRAGAAKMKRPAGAPEPAAEKPTPMVLKPPKSLEVPETVVQGPAQTWLRPKALQFNEGRIEVTLPYQFGIIIGLGLTLLVLIAFWFGHRLGQIDQRARYGKASQAASAGASSLPVRAAESETDVTDSGPAMATDTAGSATDAAVGKNVIVLARHPLEEQLKPVLAYFRDHGIETRILPYERLRSYFAEQGLDGSRLPKGDGFMLVTLNFFHNPDREGTDGHAVMKQIVEFGRGYEAPPGKESFAPNYFSDAYGMKVMP